MQSLKHEIQLRIAKLLAIVLATVPIAVCWYVYFADNLHYPYFRKGNWMIIGLFAALYVIFARIYDAFTVSWNKVSETVYSQCLAIVVSDALMFVVLWLINHSFPNLMPCLVTLLVQTLLLSLWAWTTQNWYFRVFPPLKTAAICAEKYNISSLVQDYDLAKKFDVQRIWDPSCELEDLEELKQYQAVFIQGLSSHERNVILKFCMLHGIAVFIMPRLGDVIMSGAKRYHMFHLPVLRVQRWSPYPEYVAAKRILDVVISGLCLLLLSPVMFVTAVAIKLTDGGPIFYKQERLTLDGKVFKVIKFRSMRVDAEKDGVARLSTGDKDDRVTPVGRIIRKVRIDEIPQLFNVLCGSMSLVGPRPERPEIAQQYEETLPEFRLRLQVKAGLTGYAQIYGKYNTTPYDKLQMDLMYIANPSIVEDLKILFATVKILFLPESTAGVAVGQVTAEAEEKEKEQELMGV